jgi:hypothetical protein
MMDRRFLSGDQATFFDHYPADDRNIGSFVGVRHAESFGFYNKQFYESFSKDFGLGPMNPWANISLYFVFTATITVVRDCATVVGEEIGWRGFLVLELAKRHSFAATAIISGFIWAMWHYPIFLLRMATMAVRRFGTTFHCLRRCSRLCASYGPG